MNEEWDHNIITVIAQPCGTSYAWLIQDIITTVFGGERLMYSLTPSLPLTPVG